MGREGTSRDELNAGLRDAARDMDPDAVERQVRAGADARAADGDGLTALHWVCRNAELLPDEPDDPEFHERADLRVIAMLIGAGADPNARDLVGDTPLFEAVAGDGSNLGAIRVLVLAGADLNATNGLGVTPLMSCFQTPSRYDAAELLLELGADPIQKDDLGRTAIDYAEDDGSARARELVQRMRRIVSASGRIVPERARPLSGVDPGLHALPDGPARPSLLEWVFTAWSGAWQAAGAVLLDSWGNRAAMWLWLAMTPVNLLLTIGYKWALREPLLGESPVKQALSFASVPIGFAPLLALHWYALDWVVWILTGLYLVCAVGVLCVMIPLRRRKSGCDRAVVR